ncbi:hypothetical protein JTF06_11645 [Desemzia sp. RIT804]|uniref:hypothetical protein n=1 Tax=Desemzia sp. RIT 804 TaxID=2810209 RepID=UPI00194E4283|nr:hypothetical protein [Desemzia sp. RIT 804]MBM6615537.1 hypothetical protein [Desemzia sp. RIT 804]
MKQIFAFENENQMMLHKDLAHSMFQRLQPYQLYLQQEFALKESPKAVVWTPADLATTIFSTVPIPAYTKKNIIYMSPIVEEWQSIFFEQLDSRDLPVIKNYYEQNTKSQMMEILAHELTHHSDLFLEEFDVGDWEKDIWFEEGMCFYLPRKFLLDDQAFDEISAVERTLVKEFKDTYGQHPLSDFGSTSYKGNMTSIMYDYWRSFLAVKKLIDRAEGDIKQVFSQYQDWYNSGKKNSLMDYFQINI